MRGRCLSFAATFPCLIQKAAEVYVHLAADHSMMLLYLLLPLLPLLLLMLLLLLFLTRKS